STLVRRLKGLDGKPQMPMGFAPLDKEQIDRIEKWISAGAEFSEAKPHWAYVAPNRPPAPKVRNLKWVRNPIDAFVLARLEKEGLKPSPEADRETLLRRVSLDLTGLPPTLEEIDAFLTDKSPNAYGKVVDRLLASPHYGERQARVWLDLARYADTNGFEADFSRTMWKWRDWVIDAYNANLPFDRFTIEQLAGDMLPNATIAQKIATGFHRNTMFNSEGGVDKEEAFFEVVLDRVATTGTVWLGQTLACARCHDHKYDPFSQKEFYQLYAVWNNVVAESKGEHKFGQDKLYEPEIPAPTAEQSEEIRILEAQMKQAEADYLSSPPGFDAEFGEWKASLSDGHAWRLALPARTEAKSTKFETLEDGSLLATGDVPAHDTYSLTLKPGEGWVTGLRIEALPDKSLRKEGPGRADSGNFILSKLEVFQGQGSISIKDFATTFSQEGYGTSGLSDENGDSGWAIYPNAGKAHELAASFAKPVFLRAGEELKVVLTFNSPTWGEHLLGRFRLSTSNVSSPHQILVPADVRQAAEAATPSEAHKKRLDTHFRGISQTLAPVRTLYLAVKGKLAAAKSRVPNALVLQEKPANGPIKAAMHIRGEWLNKGEMVEAGTPSVLPPLPKGTKADRLSVAKWLVDPQNPLTARVQVNRIWEQYFGRGIVETSDNFGTQGALPSHPELLDWLATEFVRLKWDMKSIHRLIVTSATYRQSSNSSAALMAKDPGNLLLARGPRFRMEAEMIRDSALAASGLLSRKIGGPSVFPHQPDGIWNSPYNGERWNVSQGEDRYRRGLYTFWKRTSPYPSFMALDAPSREVCSARRERTNTPLQALALLNDAAYVEAAKALAKRVSATPDTTQRVTKMFRLATGRRPTAAERGRLAKLAQDLQAKFAKDPEGAKAFAGTPEEAAWTMVAMTVMNLDEAITKG
ncbi:MAG TPA: DUF1549 and DUF1553 domain-containing protein, partial [Fimbriimonadaceae bacterium]|nr:DUF1549 and DUF1553 domain-containing protein [Fimbriimonadaceae bacterium]